MASNNEDIKWLYDKLKSKGYNIGSEDEFTNSLANEEDRQWYYDKATGMGLNMGSIDDFNELYAPKTESKTKEAPAEAAAAPVTSTVPQQQTPNFAAPLAEGVRLPNAGIQRALGQQSTIEDMPQPQAQPQVGEFARQQVEQFNKAVNANRAEMFEQPALRDEIGGIKAEQYNPDAVAAMERAYTSFKPKTIEEQIADIEKRIEQRSKELAPKDNMRAFLQSATASQLTPVESVFPVELEEFKNDEEMRTLMATRAQLIQAKKAKELGDADVADNKAGQTGLIGFFNGAGRGFASTISDPSTWDMGVTGVGLITEGQLYSAVEKAERGEKLTQAEDDLLTAASINAAAQSYLSEVGGYGTSAGKITGESLPFMLEFALAPTSGAASNIAKYGAKKFGVTAMKRSIGKKLAKAGLRTVGDATVAAGLTTTLGMPRVAADATQRMTGNIMPTYDEFGYIQYGGREGAEDNVASAVGKAAVSNIIENYSELLGAQFAPMLNAGGKFAKDAAEKVGLKKVTEVLSDISGSNFAKGFRGFLDKTQWHGSIGEYFEEVASNILNAAFVGDMKFDASEEGVFNLENNIDTFLGVALMGGAFSAINTVGYAVEKADNMRVNRQLKNQSVRMSEMLGDKWAGIKDQIDSAEDEQLKALLAEITVSSDYTDEQKQGIWQYAAKLKASQGANMVRLEQQIGGEFSPELNDVMESYDAGYKAQLSEAAAIKAAYDDAVSAYEQKYEPIGDDINYAITEAINIGDTERRDALVDVAKKRAAYEGIKQQARDNAEDRIAASNMRIDRLSNQGNIISATLKDGDKPIYITSGNVQVNSDNTLNISDSSSFMVAQTPEGEIITVSPDQILRIDAISPASEQKYLIEQMIWQEEAQNIANVENGSVSVQPGETYTVINDYGEPIDIQVIRDNMDGTYLINDGMQNVNMNAGQLQQMLQQSMVVNARTLREEQEAQRQQQNAAAVESAPVEQVEQPVIEQPAAEETATEQPQPIMVGDEFTNAAGETGIVQSIDNDGAVITWERADGSNYTNRMTAEDIAAMQAQPEVETQPAETTPAVAEAAAPSPEELQVESQAQEQAAQTPESVIAEMQDFEPEEKQTIINNNIQAAEQAYNDILNAKPVPGTDIASFRAEKAEWQANVDQARANLDFWNSVNALLNAPAAEEAVAISEETQPEAPISATAEAIAQAEAETNTEPTEAQKEAGNYKKGHVVIDGMNITIEQPKGSVRRGTDANGKAWETVMQNTYGYIRGTQSIDGDHIDIFLSDNPETGNVYVVDQINNDGSFDEHKVMYGFNSAEEARAAYLSNYEEGWQGLGNITEVSKEDFKKWLDSSTRKTKPFAEYASTPAPVVLDNDTEGAPQDVAEEAAQADTGVSQVDVSGLMQGITETGEAKLSDYATPVKPKKATAKKAKTEQPQKRLVSDERYAELRERMRKKLGQLNVGIDPEIIGIGAEMAVYHLENGAIKFADYARNMIADLGDAIRPFLKSLYSAARDYPGVEGTELGNNMTPYDEVRNIDVNSITLNVEDTQPYSETSVEEPKTEKTRRIPKKKENQSVLDYAEEVAETLKSEEKDVTLEEQKQEQDGLQRNDAELRSEGLSADDSGQQGELSEGIGASSESEQQESGRTDGERAGRSTEPDRTVRPRPDDSVAAEPKNTRNNHSERGEVLAPTSVDARIEANINAIELAQNLIENGEQANESQMKTLRKFSGWGGLGKAFQDPAYSQRLKELLGEEAYNDASESSYSAYYTPTYIADTLWDIAEKLGFKGGVILEGSAGIGNLLGQMPTSISERSEIQAVEKDTFTGNILKLLYPDAKVDIQGFEETQIQNGSVDLAITNVPFVTGLHVYDNTGDNDLSKKFRNIHDFCIAKNVRKLKEGGIGIFITTSGTLDNSKKLRDWVVSEGGSDFIGAFRMNNKTFIGTKVTTDIIVIRKRVNGQKSANAIDVSTVSGERVAEYDTGETKKVKGNVVPVVKQLSMDYNRYFIEHPENMAGEMAFGFEQGDTYRPTSKTLVPQEGKDQSKMLQSFVETFSPESAEAYSQRQAESNRYVMDESAEGKKLGEMYEKDGQLVIAGLGGYYPLNVNANKVKGKSKLECFNAYNAIKTALKKVLDYQVNNESDAGLKPLLKELNKAYDDFVATFGHFNKNVAISFLKNDVEYSNIFSLETYEETSDKKGNRVQKFGKSDVFKGRVIEKEKELKPTNVKDGILISIFKFGRIDVPYISEQLGMSPETVKEEIVSSGYGFENPITTQMEVSYQYLSGNVREKLRQAEQNNVDGKYDTNIKALKNIIPLNIPAHLIDFSLGSSWITPKLYQDFIKDKTDLDVNLIPIGGTWDMSVPYYVATQKNRAMGVVSEAFNKTIFGHTLIEAAMQNKTITVSQTYRNSDGTTETVIDKEATRACAAKIEEIRQDFKDWARQKMQSDEQLSQSIENTFNDMFNNYVPMSIPDDFVPEYFSGASHRFKMRPHQGKAIVRGTMQPLLLAHEVGTGKTFTLISTAMEMRRLGTARKPMIVVQNATVGQFVSSAKGLYPNAKILTLEESDRSAEGRKNFYAKIKYNDWDMIVVPQSTFEFIPDSEERQMAFVQDKIEEKLMILEQMKNNDSDGNSLITRQAEKEIEQLESELAELTKSIEDKRDAADEKRKAIARQNAEVQALEMLDRRTDAVENFDDMGIDALLVDEAHEYKHLGFATAMQRGVKGVDPSYSKKSQGVYLKTQAVLEKNNGKNVIFATGTPISNTAAEIWTFMRYLMPADTMKEYEIYYFDDFVRNFGNIQQMLEFTTSGKFKENNRFAGYVNLPELVRIWSGVSDTVLTKEAGEVQKKIPEIEGGKAQDIFLPQTMALRSVMKFVNSELSKYEKMSGKEKKENSHIPLTMYGIAKAAAVDARLVLNDAMDEPNSKTNEAVRQTLKSLKDTKDYKGTVAIFADNYQNKESGFNLYEDIRSKLIASGVPEEQIVVMKSNMSIKKKLDIFDKVNRGEVRVILGSTFTLGTGVNIQERLHTLIHLDAPNRPMDYTQRNGRILRQGNIHKEMGKPVRILRFGVEDSLDVTAYQRLKTKGAIADSIMSGKQLMQNSMVNRVLEEEEDAFGDIVAQLSGSEYALLKNNAEKNVRKYESRKKQWEADQAYIHSAKPRYKAAVQDLENTLSEQQSYLDKVQEAFKDGKVDKIEVGKKGYSSLDDMAPLFKEHNKSVIEASKSLKESNTANEQKRELEIKIGPFTFKFTTTLSKETVRTIGNLSTEVKRKITYSCPELGLESVPVKQSLLKNGVEDIIENVITGKDFSENVESAKNSISRAQSEIKQLSEREGKPFEFEKELQQSKEQLETYSELMKKELEEKEAKYAEMDKEVEEATELSSTEEAGDEEIRFRENESEDSYILYRKNFGGNSGYVGYSMSKRAQSARGEGRFPKTDFMKEYNISANTLKTLVDVGIINDNEWHHTSKFGNETTFYGWDNPLYAEFYEANKKEVDKKVKEFRSKTKPMMSDFRKEDGSIDFAALTEAEDNYNDEKFAIAEMFDNYVEKESIAEDVSEEQLFNNTVTESAVKMASSMNTDIRVVTNISELPEGAAKRAIEKGRKVKGWYDTNTGEVVLYLPNADSAEDARKTVFHEIVAHKGLREMLGDDFSTFLQNVFLNSNKKVRSKIVALASANNWNIETATEEYLATLAENGFDSEAERSYFQRIKDTLIDLLRKAGIRLGFKLSDKELRYILWRSYQMQQNKGIVGEAENVAMQSVLKVGNYAPEGDVLFRDSTAAVQIRDDYERKVSGFLNNLDEAYHDYLRSVRIAQDLIVEKSGTKIQDYEDVYKNAMRKSSMDAVEVREFHEKMADPFLKHASKMIDGKSIDGRKMTSEHIDKYLHLLHAPERNEVFARRDARRIKEEEIQKLDKQKAAGLITPADYNTAKSEAEAKEQDNYKKFRENDYSGLTEMFGEGKTVQELEALAKEYTNKFEQIIGQKDIDILQNDIKQISHFTLEKTYESGIISRKTMEELETMFEHYVPLRGFKDDVASDVYEYVGSEANPGDKKVVKAAKGRKSAADSPIANLLVMGTNAIVSGNKNKLVKMSLLNLAENHPTDLLTVSSMWYEKQPDGTWEPKVANIPKNATAKEVAQIVEAFEEEMKTKAKAKMARRRTGKSDIPLRVLNKQQEMQHVVRVMRNGTEYVVYINGNPKLAQAVNGLLNIDSTNNPVWKIARSMNSYFSRINTSWNPEFIARNLARDVVASSITAAVKEGPKYTAMFEKNLMNSLSPIGVKGVRQGKFTGMYNLYVRYKNGKLDMNNPRDRYFNEFIKNGGETGITQMLTIDSYKNKMKKMVDKNGFIEFENATKAVWSSIVDGVDFLNKGVENACRFSAYMTSRQLGKSITESIYDAKEISVNFNRKGSGAMGNRLFVTNFMFFNAAMQGMFKQIDLFKKYPAKMSGLAFGLSSIAFLMALICINAGDGDDEEMPGYFDINPFTRRGNFMVPIGDGKFAKIPLAYEVAVWYGMGDIFATIMYDEHNNQENELLSAFTQIGMQLSSILPMDVVEGKNIMDPERTFLEQVGKAFIPSYAKPFAEAWGYEQDFLGRPINNRTDFNERKPEWMRAKKSTSKFFIGLSKGITEITGGSKYKKGSIDNVIINPGSMEHLTKNLSGGFGTFIINSSKTVQALMGEEDYKDAFNVPFARSFYMNLDNEYYRNRRINDRWYYYVAESESLDFNFKMTIADPEIPKEEKDALKESYRQNGELEIMKVTKAYSKADKKYEDRIREAEKSGKEELVDKLYEMQSELRRKAVNKIDSIVEDHK